MKLSSEDELRLNVLLANAVAIRLDEARGVVHGLGQDDEFEFRLSEANSVEAAIQAARAYLSTRVLGSPKHFPTHLRRWSGLGQISNAPLEKLLLLGDPEAIYAVASSSKVTAELAERAWWCLPEPAIARALLRNEVVSISPLGQTLAAWLLDYLPFEESPENLYESVVLLLQPNVLDDSTRRKIWAKGRRNKIYRAAFLSACPLRIPLPNPSGIENAGTRLSESRNQPQSLDFESLYKPEMQALIAACIDVLSSASHPIEVIAVFKAIESHFRIAGDNGRQGFSALDGEVGESLARLADVREEELNPLLGRSDAVGTVMRAQLRPVTEPVLNSLKRLVAF